MFLLLSFFLAYSATVPPFGRSAVRSKPWRVPDTPGDPRERTTLRTTCDAAEPIGIRRRSPLAPHQPAGSRRSGRAATKSRDSCGWRDSPRPPGHCTTGTPLRGGRSTRPDRSLHGPERRTSPQADSRSACHGPSRFSPGRQAREGSESETNDPVAKYAPWKSRLAHMGPPGVSKAGLAAA